MVDTIDSPVRTGLRVRGVNPDDDELTRWLDVQTLGFKQGPAGHPDAAAARRPRLRDHRLTAAVDQSDRIVASFRSWDTTLTVPGGPGSTSSPNSTGSPGSTNSTVLADAISSVAVLPTHRRQGALSALMTADLEAAVERGVPVAILIASEATIYGRYGFGPATAAGRWVVDVPAARLRPEVTWSGSLELIPETELREPGPGVYARARRPGGIDRDGLWWDRSLGLAPMPGEDRKPMITVLHRDAAGVAQGYLCYTAKDEWTDRLTQTVATVIALEAATPDAYVGLWSYLLNVDLIATVSADDRPVDEPLPWLLTDGRRARMASRADFQWSRLLDPAAALSARGYTGAAGSVTFEIVDRLGWAAGRYALEVDGAGQGSCARSTAPAQVSVDVDALSAAWLGGGDLYAAAVGGRARELAPRGIERLAAMLATPRAPWTATWF